VCSNATLQSLACNHPEKKQFWHSSCIITSAKGLVDMDITPVKNSSVSDLQKAKIQKVAQDFETMFTSMMLKEMRKSVGDNPLMPQSFGEKIFTEMLDDEYSKSFGKNASIGLADLIVKELERQELSGGLPQITDASGNSMLLLDNAFVPSQSSSGTSQDLSGSTMTRVGKWDSLISEACEEYDLDKSLISAVIAQESGGNQYAVSKAGAKGLMQLMDSTARDLGVSNSFSPRHNIMGGAKYLRSLLDKYDGNEELALASYNAGPGAVDKYNGVPPYAETQHYVKAVQKLKSFFSNDQEL